MRQFLMISGAAGGIALVVAALWLWQGAEELVMSWQSRRMGLWAIWSGAAAVAVAGQIVMLKCVAEPCYQRRGGMVQWGLLVMVVAGLIGAVAFGMAAK